MDRIAQANAIFFETRSGDRIRALVVGEAEVALRVLSGIENRGNTFLALHISDVGEICPHSADWESPVLAPYRAQVLGNAATWQHVT